jgi:hypothetical protein
MPSQPQFTVTMRKWTPQANLGDQTFTFQPPAGAKLVPQLPVDCGAPRR